jgi:hypothetical protein
MDSEEELRKRVEELEWGLAQAKWRADMDRETAQRKEYARKESKKENNTFFIFIALCALPFIWLLFK